jgi:cell division GTPase FtsZ
MTGMTEERLKEIIERIERPGLHCGLDYDDIIFALRDMGRELIAEVRRLRGENAELAAHVAGWRAPALNVEVDAAGYVVKKS